jgi:hypothetical protein
MGHVKLITLIVTFLLIGFLVPVLSSKGGLDSLAGVFNARHVRTWMRNGGITSNYKEVKKADIPLINHALTKDLGIEEGYLTKYFDIKTRETLKKFQKKYGLLETGIMDTPTQEKMNALYSEDFCPKFGNGDSTIDMTRVVGKGRPLAANYIPNGLVPVPEGLLAQGKQCVSGTILGPLQEMFRAAAKDDIGLLLISGYRRYDIQSTLRDDIVAREGAKGAKEIAVPGESEHQLGLAVDILSVDTPTTIDARFAKTKAGTWLAENAWKYGFTMSYPKGDEDLGGIAYEPWHYRYVGKGLAKILHEQGVSFRRFVEQGFATVALH